jgi:hypothetical protein
VLKKESAFVDHANRYGSVAKQVRFQFDFGESGAQQMDGSRSGSLPRWNGEVPGHMNRRKSKNDSTKLTADEEIVLWPFVDLAEEGDEALARYLIHCGIDADDIARAGDPEAAILEHYRRPDGTYDISAAAHDLARWPPIMARLKELKRQRRAHKDQISEDAGTLWLK